MHVGIDLGTTYCCVSYLDDEGRTRVIHNAYNEPTTPSVVWFDGRSAVVGQKANQRKLVGGQHIFEFVKRDIGVPIEIPAGTRAAGGADAELITVAPYEIDRFKYGAAGISAIILRTLKREAIRHFKQTGRIDRAADERSIELDAVITVPAYFGEKERQETKLAGYAAGLNVIGIINEPTAAALCYGLSRRLNQRLMVFDLGGGTLDVTVLQMRDGEPRVLSSVGNNRLGGRDWDEVIERYIYERFQATHGRPIPDDPQHLFEVQELALRAKLALSEELEHTLEYSTADGELTLTLHRSAPPGASEFDLDADDAFHFDQRAGDLLARCSAICEAALQETLPTGERRRLAWSDIDEIVLAGGACRMPMIPELLERLSGRRIRRQVEGFDLDTAIAIGAALYGQHHARVIDVVSHGLGVRVIVQGRHQIDYLIQKDTPLPTSARRTFRAPAHALLSVYEGESPDPLECAERGQLHLENPEGQVAITFDLDRSGLLRVTAAYAEPEVRKELELRNDLFMYEGRATPLRERIQALTINN